MTNEFCFLLSNGLFISDKAITDSISFSPCCIYKDQVSNFASADWKNINNWTENCNDCKLKEDSNKKSRRNEMNSWFTDVKQEGITHLEIDYSNACNAACGICNSMASSSIANIMRKEGKNYIKTPNVKQQVFFDTIENLDLSSIRLLKFRGGEPFYATFHEKLLEKISIPENAMIMYQTNGSIYPSDDWWNLAKNFKEVHLSFSIDAVYERFNYIRSNLNFEKVKNNILKILIDKRINLSASIECTINPLNAYYFDEMFNFYLELKKFNKNIKLNWHPCMGDWGIENIPPVLRELITKKFKNNNLSKVINSYDFDVTKFNNFINVIQNHEKRFKLDSYKVFPEIYPLIMDYYTSIN
jgi:organic radical activating enzyme